MAMNRKRWHQLSRRQQRAIVAAVAVQELLSAAALLDLRHRPSTQVRGSKKLWVAAAFVNFVGPLAYFAFGRRRGVPRG
jgi:Phospholipase_D-nuclease N-terminal